jgi:hypothetical protein
MGGDEEAKARESEQGAGERGAGDSAAARGRGDDVEKQGGLVDQEGRGERKREGEGADGGAQEESIGMAGRGGAG